MLHTPLWKRLLILGVILLGFFYAAPNVFYAKVEAHNDAALLSGPEAESARAGWPDWLPSSLVNLGLDLRGGAHLLAEVQVADVYEARIDGMWPDVRDALRGLVDQVGTVRRQPSVPGVLRVAIGDPSGMDAALQAVRALATPVVSLTGIGQNDIEVTVDGTEIVVQLSEAERVATDTRTIQQSLEIIRRRVDEVGTREPTIQRQGVDRILIQVPGIGSAADLKALIGTTAKLTFNPVVGRTADAGAEPGPRNLLLPAMNEEGVFYIVEQTPVVTGEELTDAQPAFDDNNRPAVNFRFDPAGARKFGDYTANKSARPSPSCPTTR